MAHSSREVAQLRIWFKLTVWVSVKQAFDFRVVVCIMYMLSCCKCLLNRPDLQTTQALSVVPVMIQRLF